MAQQGESFVGSFILPEGSEDFDLIGCLRDRLGGHPGDFTVSGVWSYTQSVNHIIWLELMTVFCALVF